MRAVFALLLIAILGALAVKIASQYRTLGRSPIVLGAATGGVWERWFDYLGPLGLLFWPALWLWIALGGQPPGGGPRRAVGLALIAAGATLWLASLFLMGRAWRIGIDPGNRTDLAERGAHRWVRHPMYSGMLVMLIGTVMVIPHPVVGAAAILTALGIVYQAYREERHLLRTFGDRYARYAARTGGFVPRLRRDRAHPSP
jgi:hypothetical protein